MLAGEFIVVNKFLVDDLKNLGIWNKQMKDTIIVNNGSIQNINSIPQNIKIYINSLGFIYEKYY